MPEKGTTNQGVTRRELIVRGGGILLALEPTINELAKLGDILSPDSSIGFVDAKERKLKSKKAVMVFGGMTVANAEPVAAAVAPAFEEPVIYTEYSKMTQNASSLVDEYLEIKEKMGIEELTLYCHSEGMQVGGQFAKLLREREMETKQKRTKIPRIILDGPTVNFDDTKFKAVGDIPFPRENPFLGEVVNFIIYSKYYGDPFQPGTASGDLLKDQVATLDDGITYTAMLAGAARENNSEVFALWPTNPAADPEIDDAKSQAHLRHFFPRMLNILVKGSNEGHANPDHNKDGYSAALEQVNALSRENW
jgi:pimeloyl-ACP methyl ester carboxylesterase